MNVLLIETTSEAYRNNPFSQMDRFLEPLAIEYIGAHLKSVGHDVELIQQLSHRNDQIIAEVVKRKPDVVGFSCMTYSYPDTLELAEAIKQEMPFVQTILGGYHVIGMDTSPECFDFVIRGEGEIAVELVLDFLAGKKDLQFIPGLRFYKGERWDIPQKVSKPFHLQPPIRLPRENYRSMSMGENLPDTRLACVVARRGCPFRCDFCCTPQLFPGSRQLNSPKELVVEILKLRDEMGVNTVNIRDETFSNRTYIKAFCKEMIERNVKISWRAFANIGTLDSDLLKLMAEAGCHMLFFGIEASDLETLKLRRKNFKEISLAVKDVYAAQKAGIFIRAGFIVGHENDTRESFHRHEEFLLRVRPDELYLSFLTPFPGTPLYQRMKKEGRLLTDDFRKYDCEHPIVDISIPEDELIDLRNQLYRRFYASSEWTNYVVRRAIENESEAKSIERFCAFVSQKLSIADPFATKALESVTL